MSDKEIFFVFEDALRYTNYLKDIKGLSENSQRAYLRDLKKFSDYIEKKIAVHTGKLLLIFALNG